MRKTIIKKLWMTACCLSTLLTNIVCAVVCACFADTLSGTYEIVNFKTITIFLLIFCLSFSLSSFVLSGINYGIFKWGLWLGKEE